MPNVACNPNFHMSIANHYKIRHLLLKTLLEYDDKFEASSSISERQIHFRDICKKIPQFDSVYVLDNLDYLQSKGEIYCSKEFDNSKFTIISNGRHAYLEKRYLTEGQKEFRNLFDQRLKIISTIVLLLIAVATFIVNIVQTQKNKYQIEQIKSDLKKLHEQKK